MSTSSYLIVGGGPAGLTMARMLKDHGAQDVIILEASHKIGGKCLTGEIGDHVVEFGTCYAVWGHKYVLTQMKKLGIQRNFLKAQRIDDRELMDYIRDGSGPSFIYQVLKYTRLRNRLMARARKGDSSTNAEFAQSTRDWLRANNLGKIENMMHRVVTSIGYGYLDRVPLIHAFRWVDFDMMLTGLLKFTVMPDGGWQHFWDRFSDGLDVRLEQSAVSIERDEANVCVRTASGDEYRADVLINTIPIGDFCEMTEATAAEQYVAESVSWSGYTTTLIAVDEWAHSAPVNSWSDTCATDQNDGKLLFHRYECESEEGQKLFTVGQLSTAYTKDELAELVTFDAEQRGAKNPRIVQQAVWQYMPTYSADRIRSGLLQTMENMQGEHRTFHTGSTFSHEAVSTICAFNAQLLQKVVA